MTSWIDLSFEVRSQILSYYIAATLDDVKAGSSGGWGILSLLVPFAISVLKFLHNAPDMLDEAISIVDSMIKQHSLLHEELRQKVETLRPRYERRVTQERKSRVCDELTLLKFCKKNLKDNTWFKREKMEVEASADEGDDEIQLDLVRTSAHS